MRATKKPRKNHGKTPKKTQTLFFQGDEGHEKATDVLLARPDFLPSQGLGFLPVKDLAAIARLAALAALLDNATTHKFRASVVQKEGPDLEARLPPKMETRWRQCARFACWPKC